MSEPFWHYTDAQGAEHGPVTADAVRAAFNGGRIGPASQFWHEGLPGWIDLPTAAGELGLGAGAPPPDPYAAPRARVEAESSYVAGSDVVPAGFIRRFAAMFLDQLIIGVGMFAVMFAAIMAMVMAGGGSDPGNAFVAIFYLVYFVAVAYYYAGQESSSAQATLGKRALGIKVVDRDGRQLTFAHALGRWFSVALSYLTMYIGFLMAAFPPRKLALHDMVSGTQVVDRHAYTSTPHLQRREVSGCLVMVVIGLVVLPIVAIFAAIAISQYQTYRTRAGLGAIEATAPAPVQVAAPRD
jgi:uncharacterized RDD family membrane protein YckC